jgi:hypothetical protein
LRKPLGNIREKDEESKKPDSYLSVKGNLNPDNSLNQ